MKGLKTIITVVLLALSFNAIAGNDKKAEINRIQQRVVTALSQTESDLEGAVNIRFTIEADGTVHIVSLESNADDLKEAVEARLNDLRIKWEFGKDDNEYNMNFIFHAEE